jgi:DNA-binding beta-propeller fold protein YncE
MTVPARPGSDLYVADFGNNRVARIGAGGAVSTVVTGVGPNSVSVDGAGLIYMTERTLPRVRRIDPATGHVVTVLGR